VAEGELISVSHDTTLPHWVDQPRMPAETLVSRNLFSHVRTIWNIVLAFGNGLNKNLQVMLQLILNHAILLAS